jgi:hypothetical protein
MGDRDAALYLTRLPRDSDADLMSRARRLLCEAKGLQPHEIDPVTGCDLSRRSYEAARDTWRGHGPLDDDSRPHFEKARAYWAERRPEFTAGDDWTPRQAEGEE